MKPIPLPPEPTNADLARGVREVHDCLDAVGAKLDEHIASTLDYREATGTRLDAMGAALLAIGARVGAGKGGEIKALTPLRIAGVITTVLAIWTAILKLLPVLPAINHALLR